MKQFKRDQTTVQDQSLLKNYRSLHRRRKNKSEQEDLSKKQEEYDET